MFPTAPVDFSAIGVFSSGVFELGQTQNASQAAQTYFTRRKNDMMHGRVQIRMAVCAPEPVEFLTIL